jgi:hypothetical protein
MWHIYRQPMLGSWRSVLLLLAAVLLAGCACRRAAISRRTPLSREITAPAQIADIVEPRIHRPDTVQMQSNLVARADGLLGRMAFEIGLRWLRPDHVRLRVRRAGVNLLEIIQAPDEFTLYLWKLREGFRGPPSDLDPEVAQAIPVTDLSALSLVPLIDELLAERLTDLQPASPPRWSCWRRHLWLAGVPDEASRSPLSAFEADQWALRPDTLTVEGLALRLPSEDDDKPLWLSLTVDRYDAVDAPDGETTSPLILPSEFHLSVARYPWRRWWRGELWSVAGSGTRLVFDRPMTPHDFELRLQPGAVLHPLREFRGIPMAAIREN